MVLELISMIGDVLKFIAYLLFGFWIVVTFGWLLFSPLKNTPHWVDYLGVGSLLLQAIMAAVLFIRHVYHLGGAPTGGNRHTQGSQTGLVDRWDALRSAQRKLRNANDRESGLTVNRHDNQGENHVA